MGNTVRVDRERFAQLERDSAQVADLELENRGLRTSLRSAMSDGQPRIVRHTHLGPLAVREIALSHALDIHEYLVSGEDEATKNADIMVAVARKFEEYLTGTKVATGKDQEPVNLIADPGFEEIEIPTDEQGNLPLPEPGSIYRQYSDEEREPQLDQHGVQIDFSKKFEPGTYTEAGYAPGRVD